MYYATICNPSSGKTAETHPQVAIDGAANALPMGLGVRHQAIATGFTIRRNKRSGEVRAQPAGSMQHRQAGCQGQITHNIARHENGTVH